MHLFVVVDVMVVVVVVVMIVVVVADDILNFQPCREQHLRSTVRNLLCKSLNVIVISDFMRSYFKRPLYL